MPKPLDITNFDTSISPADDFYHYANGGWLKKNPIPDEFSRYGSFDALREDNREIVKSIIESAAKKGESHQGKLLGDFYNMGMNQEKINEQGLSPIHEDLQRIELLHSKKEITTLIAHLYKNSQATLFYLYPSPDRDNAEMIIANLHQGGMGLSDVDYYRNNDDRSKEIREKYLEYMAQMFSMTGISKVESEKAAAAILTIESKLAHAGMTRLEERDPHETFNKLNLQRLHELSPSIAWKEIFDTFRLNSKAEVNIAQPEFFKALSVMIDNIDIQNWKYYFKWKILNSSASFLSSNFEEEKFNFYSKFLSGKKLMQPRWKRTTAATEDALGEAIGKLFVEKYFPPSAKEKMISLVENLRSSLKGRIDGLDWMSAETKIEAHEKLKRIRVKIGYPDKWRSFKELSFNNNSYYENYRQAAIFNMNFELSKIGQASDKDEWHMTPQTVNAYYHPLLNEIVFPAGILQPPFFYNDADDAINYGAIGVVIGHEMTHGFDDQGRKFDKNGNLNDWWTKEDAERFSERSEVLEKQFNEMKVTDKINADGKLSLGENIADLGGLNIAFSALQKAWDEQNPEKETDGFTPEQRFYLSYAHLWANNIREKETVRMTKEDVHSLGINRVNGPLPNLEAFHKAFNIVSGDLMYLEEDKRAKIW